MNLVWLHYMQLTYAENMKILQLAHSNKYISKKHISTVFAAENKVKVIKFLFAKTSMQQEHESHPLFESLKNQWLELMLKQKFLFRVVFDLTFQSTELQYA